MPDRPKRLTVAPVEPGFAEIKADGTVVGCAMADYWNDWKVYLFTGPSLRDTYAVEPYVLGSLAAVRADVRKRVESDGPWWSGGGPVPVPSDQAATREEGTWLR